MLKKVMAVAFASVCWLSAQADTSAMLYWDVNQILEPKQSFDFARIYAVSKDDGSAMALSDGYNDFYLSDKYAGGEGYGLVTPVWSELPENAADYKYTVSLYAGDDLDSASRVGWQTGDMYYEYAQIADFIAEMGTTPAGGALAFSVIPEPTSGLLLLFGLAGLALRRRRI